jgi:AcrR family transcriptional regulator
MVPSSTAVKKYEVIGISMSKKRQEALGEIAVRGRILEAAFAAFMKKSYAATSTAEIAASARVSKREIYAQVGNKQEMLVACISERARRLQMPTDLPVPRDREILARVLTSFGAQLLREISDPTVIAVFRLAIAEAVQAREVAQVLDSIGRETGRAALGNIMAQALALGLLKGRPDVCAEQFSGLLWGNLMISLLLGVAKRPNSHEIDARAHDAVAAFLQLHPAPDVAKRPFPLKG